MTERPQVVISDVLANVDREYKIFTRRDSHVFIGKLLLLSLLATAATALVIVGSWYTVVPGDVILGVLFAHAVELQHQVLHGTAFRSSRVSRGVGFLLGAPMMVSYSRYRALHLLHHRYLGTDKDTEFFEYAVADRLTAATLLRSALNVRRWAETLTDMARSWSSAARFDQVITDDHTNGRIRAEYRMMSVLLTGLLAGSITSAEPLIVTLWFGPLVVGEVTHLLIELPEHLFCDRSTTDVFHNTRSILGSRFSFWLTNGNNLHLEHHARMGVPINKLPRLHSAFRPHALHYRDNYWQFYGEVVRAIRSAPTRQP
jgi:fatty acid desaturase